MAGRRVRQNYSADSPAAEHPNKQIGSRSFFLGIRNLHLALQIHYDLHWILGWASVCHSCVLLSYDAKSNFWNWKKLDRSFQLLLISSIYSSVWDKAWNSNNICHHWNVDGANNQIGTFPFRDLTRWRWIQFRACGKEKICKTILGMSHTDCFHQEMKICFLLIPDSSHQDRYIHSETRPSEMKVSP